jgi:hypothetical protein
VKLTLFIVVASVAASAQTETVLSWYPLQPGNTWVYQKESLGGHREHPDFERWTTEETIVSLVPAPEHDGMVATRRTKVLSDTMSPGFIPGNNQARREAGDTHILIRKGCVYLLDGVDAIGGKDGPAEYCFPITNGAVWNRDVRPPGDPDYVWHVIGLNGDAFGPPSARTWRTLTRAGSGTTLDRWFTEGVGLVQQVMEHHGTYDEDRRLLLKATIDGKTQEYQLPPAHIPPYGDGSR